VRSLLGFCVTIVALGLSGCGSTASHEQALEELVGLYGKMTAKIKSIDNAEDAKAAAPALNGYLDQLEKLSGRVKNLPNVTKSQDKELKEKYMPKLQKAGTELGMAIGRAMLKPGVKDHLSGFFQRFQKVSASP